jgi:hypothetical protein
MNCTVLVGCCVGVEEREEVGDCDGTSGVETREAPSKSLRPYSLDHHSDDDSRRGDQGAAHTEYQGMGSAVVPLGIELAVHHVGAWGRWLDRSLPGCRLGLDLRRTCTRFDQGSWGGWSVEGIVERRVEERID